VLLILLGLLQLVFAIRWSGDSVGLALGSISLVLGAVLAGLFLQPAMSSTPTRDEEADRVVHEPGKQTLRDSFSHPAFVAILVLLTLFAALRVGVHVASRDRATDQFPSACASGKLEGCNRVALLNPNNNAPDHTMLEVFTVPTPRYKLSAAVDGFLDSWPRTTVLTRVNDTASDVTFWHARVTTQLWSFADDFLVKVSCILEGEGRLSIAEMQGTLRIGKGDMDVNYERNAALLRWLQDAKARGNFPDEDGC